MVVDNTNPSVEERSAIIEVGRAYDARLVGYFFESILADCAARNAGRAGSEVVPDVGLFATRSRLRLPSWDEGFDELWYVRIAEGGGFDIEPWDVEATAGG